MRFLVPAIALLAARGAAGGPAALIADASSAPKIIPSVASTPGSHGSFYKTGVELYNATVSPESGHFVFHPAGTPGSPGDPSLAYSVPPGRVQNIPDLLAAMGRSGIGSADVIPDFGPAPVSVVRVFNDAGASGTTGLTETLFEDSEALAAGEATVLLAPWDLVNFRFNVGVRTLSSGAAISVTVRDSNGNAVTTVSKTYPATYFEQRELSDFLGVPTGSLSGGPSLTIDVTAGRLIIYGATADNITQDPSGQFPPKLP
jgi:hypothetical protein